MRKKYKRCDKSKSKHEEEGKGFNSTKQGEKRIKRVLKERHEEIIDSRTNKKIYINDVIKVRENRKEKKKNPIPINKKRRVLRGKD